VITLLIGTTSLLAGNVLSAVATLRRDWPFAVFHLSLVLFLLARPWLDLLRGELDTQIPLRFHVPALWTIVFSLVGLQLGRLVSARAFERLGSEGKGPRHLTPWTRTLGYACLVAALVVAMATMFYTSIDMWAYAREYSYAEMYARPPGDTPVLVRLVSNVAVPLLCAALAFFPRRYWLLLALYVLASFPLFLAGQRSALIGPIAFWCAFTAVYLGLFRAQGPSRLRPTRRQVAVGDVVAIVVAGAVAQLLVSMDDARFGRQTDRSMDPVTSLVYSQSVTYAVVATGIGIQDTLPGEPRIFSFGKLFDEVRFSTLGQVFFEVEPLADHTVEMATKGHAFDAAYGYALFKDEYLDGRGSGSSYLVEMRLDFGLVGVLIFSGVLGVLLSATGRLFSGRWLLNMVLLSVLLKIFFLPRNTSFDWLLLVISPHFWVVVLLVAALRSLDRFSLWQAVEGPHRTRTRSGPAS